MAQLQVTIEVAHAQRQQVGRLELKASLDVKGHHMMDLQHKGTTTGGTRRMVQEEFVPDLVPLGRPGTRLAALVNDRPDLRKTRHDSV